MLRSIEDGRAVASGRIFRVGFGGLLRGGREEWRTFVPSILAALVQGGAMVAAASGLGWVTSHVITPAYASGRTGAGAAFSAVAVLRVCGLVTRRVTAGLTQFLL